MKIDAILMLKVLNLWDDVLFLPKTWRIPGHHWRQRRRQWTRHIDPTESTSALPFIWIGEWRSLDTNRVCAVSRQSCVISTTYNTVPRSPILKPGGGIPIQPRPRCRYLTSCAIENPRWQRFYRVWTLRQILGQLIHLRHFALVQSDNAHASLAQHGWHQVDPTSRAMVFGRHVWYETSRNSFGYHSLLI